MVEIGILLCGGLGLKSFSRLTLVRLPEIHALPAPHPLAVSGDGSTVIGQFSPGTAFVFRNGNLRRFRPAPEKRALDQYVTAVSHDGSVIVGGAGGAYVWNRGTVTYPSSASSYAVGVSADGRSVAYYVEKKGQYEGVIKSGTQKRVVSGLAPVAISGNGQVLVGNATIGTKMAAAYSKNNSLYELSFDPIFTDTIASATDQSGEIIVGSAINRMGTAAAIWERGKFAKLPSASTNALAKCITADGLYIGGFADTEAVIWDKDRVRHQVNQLLGNPRGWKFESVNGIAKTGNVITITGWGHFGTKEAGYYAKVRIQ